MSTTETVHEHSFPCNPPGGTLLRPGPCGCGKTYPQNEADLLLARALQFVADAYGVPPRESEDWAVAWGGSGNLNDGSGYVEVYDDDEDARDHARFYEGGSVVRRRVIALRWETVPAMELEGATDGPCCTGCGTGCACGGIGHDLNEATETGN